MASLVSPKLRQALRDGAPTALICFIDHPVAPVRVWSRGGNLYWNGFTWQGVGILGKISGITKTSDLAIKQVTLSLRGLPTTSDVLLAARVRNRQAQVWFAAIERQRVIGDPELILDCICDYQTLKIDDNMTATITITANVGFWNIERASNKAWTHEQQQADFPGDTGLSLLPQLTNKDSNWRQS